VFLVRRALEKQSLRFDLVVVEGGQAALHMQLGPIVRQLLEEGKPLQVSSPIP
jgi:hypothetical protein